MLCVTIMFCVFVYGNNLTGVSGYQYYTVETVENTEWSQKAHCKLSIENSRSEPTIQHTVEN